MNNLPKNWKKENNKLKLTTTFNDFQAALDFVTKVGDIAQAANHHPDILLHDYKKVTIETITHSENALTSKDYSLAQDINTLLEK